MKKIKKMSKKSWLVMLLVMLCVLLIYAISSGVFTTHSSYGNVLSFAKGTEIAEGDDWSLYKPEKEDLLPYFVYHGDKSPRSNIQLRAVLYYVEDGKKANARQVEWNPYYDKHFFFGEKRYCFEEADDRALDKVACKIVWDEYKNGEIYSAYVFTNGLTDEEKTEATDYTDQLTKDGRGHFL